MEKKEFLILALTIQEMMEELRELAAKQKKPRVQERLLAEVTLRVAVFEGELPNHKLSKELTRSINLMLPAWKRTITRLSGE